jgi:hypothetical protein
MNDTSTNLVYIVAGITLLGFSGLGLIAISDLEHQYGAFTPSAWGAATLSIVSAVAGAAALLRVA